MPYSPQPPTDDVDVPRLALPLRRHALPLLSAALLAGAITYVAASREAPSYTTMSSVVTVSGDENSLVGDSLVAAPPVAPGVFQQALRDQNVIEDIARRVLASDLSPALARDLAQTVRAQQNNTAFTPVTINAAEGARSNLYEVWGRTQNPASAQVLVNASVDALMQWDRERALGRIALARTSLQQQLNALSRNEPPMNASNARWDAYESIKAQLLRSLARVDLLGPAAVGTLEVVARAPEPASPVAASPWRRAGLAALLALFVAAAAILLFEAWRRRVYDAHSLHDLGVPLLGQLPGLPADAPGRGAPLALRAGPLQDSLGFLRVNVLSQLTADQPRRVVFSSTQEGAGTSSVVAALAASLAAAGQRVLIVDAHPQAPQQAALWPAEGRTFTPGGASAAVPTQGVADRIDLLSLNALDPGQVRALVERQAASYDVTLIDTPPLLRRSDALLWANQAVGIVLVLDPGASSANEVEQVLQSAQLAKVRVLGVVLNQLRLPGETRQPAEGLRATGRDLRSGEATVR